MLFDSITTFSASAISLRIRGITTARSPVRVLTQNDRAAPADRYRPESVVQSPPARSSLTATVCSAVSQSQGSPFAEHIPCPNCVTLNAVQCISGIAEINPATTLVFPIFLVCPPTTIIAITHHTIHRNIPAIHHKLTSKSYRNQRRFNLAKSRRYSFKGRAGLPQNTSPGPRIFFPLKTPAPPPRITPAPTVACSPIPTCPPKIASSSTTLDPEIPVCAAMITFFPIRQLCPICTRLSIFVPRPIRVSPSAPRSIVVFAPISTSSSTHKRPC